MSKSADSQEKTPHSSLDALLEELPEAYAAWEQTVKSSDHARIEARIESLLMEESKRQLLRQTPVVPSPKER
jgi:hypothetical protein